jgi:hypothetical protein
MEHIAVDYGVDKGTARRSIQRVEDVPDTSGILALPGEEVPGGEKLNGEELIVDVTEHLIGIPKNKRHDWYSGKKNGTRLNRES